MAGTVTLHTDQLTLTTPTVSLYPDGSDTAAETGTSATEATNRKGTYTFSNATATGLHLIILISSATQRWYGWAVLATSGNIVAYDTRAEAIRMQATASTGVQDVNATQLGGDAQSLTDLKDFADAGYDPATNKVEGVKLVDMTTTNSDMRGTDNALTTLGSNAPAGWINEAAFANDAITDAKVASDVTIASVTGAVGSVTGNVGGNVAGSVGSVTGAVGSVTGNVGGNVTGTIGGLATQAKADVNAEVDTALTDYDAPTRTEATSDKNEILTRLGTPDDTDIATDIAAVKTVADGVKAKTDQLTFTVANKVDATAEATLGDEQIDEIADGVAYSLSQSGIVVDGFTQEALDDIESAVSAVTASADSSVANGGPIEKIIGGDYLSSLGNAQGWSLTNAGDLVSFAGASVTCYITVGTQTIESSGGAISTTTGATRAGYVEFDTDSWTDAAGDEIAAGVGEYQIVITASGGGVLKTIRGKATLHQNMGP